MNKDMLAAIINESECQRLTIHDLQANAKGNNLVVLFGASDDLMEFRGAINDEVGAYEGGFAFISDNNLLQPDLLKNLDSESAEKVLHHFPDAKAIEAIWCKGDSYSWTYKTDIPHATFDIIEDGEPYCRGIVFSLDELVSQADKLKALKTNAFNALNTAVTALHNYACACEIGEERTKAFAIYQAARLSPRAEG